MAVICSTSARRSSRSPSPKSTPDTPLASWGTFMSYATTKPSRQQKNTKKSITYGLFKQADCHDNRIVITAARQNPGKADDVCPGYRSGAARPVPASQEPALFGSFRPQSAAGGSNRPCPSTGCSRTACDPVPRSSRRPWQPHRSRGRGERSGKGAAKAPVRTRPRVASAIVTRTWFQR